LNISESTAEERSWGVLVVLNRRQGIGEAWKLNTTCGGGGENTPMKKKFIG